MGTLFQTNTLNQMSMLVIIPDVEMTIDKLVATLLNDIPDSNPGLNDSILHNGGVAALYAYIDGKYGNRAMVSATVQMQIVEYGNFELNLDRAKRYLTETFKMDGEEIKDLISLVKGRIIVMFPEFEEKANGSN